MENTEPGFPSAEEGRESPAPVLLRNLISDALRYWEPRRLLYNAALALVVAGYFFAGLPGSRAALTLNNLLVLFLLAVTANLLYCTAYVADLFAQWSEFRALWLRTRGLLLALGILLAAVLTRFVALGFFASLPAD